MVPTDRVHDRGAPAGRVLGALWRLPGSVLRRVWRVYWGIWHGAFSRLGLKRYMPRTLFGRTLMIIVTPVILAQAIATYYFYDQHWDRVTLRLSQAVAGEIAVVLEEIAPIEDAELRSEILTRMARHLGLIISIDPPRDLPAAEPLGTFEILRYRLDQAIADRIDRPFWLDPNVTDQWAEIRIALDDGVMTVLVPSYRLFTTTSWLFIVWMTGSAILLLLIAIAFMRNQIRPIRRLARAADAFGKGRDIQDFKLEGATEVRQAARAFLAMRNRIHRQLTQRTEMLAGVSHDLRTPLTRMKLELEMLGQDEDATALKADVEEMERMIDAYLAFARGEDSEDTRTTDPHDLVTQLVVQARREGMQVDVAPGSAPPIQVRRQALRRCLSNLVSNAGRYGSQVRVTVRGTGGHVEILVDDDGPGIADERLEDVFKPFYRLEPSRNVETGGTGLGLTIARDIARNHGGDITLARSPMGGLRAMVRLPL